MKIKELIKELRKAQKEGMDEVIFSFPGIDYCDELVDLNRCDYPDWTVLVLHLG